MRASPFLGYDKIAKLLIQSGANINVVGNQGYTPLIAAAQKGKEMINSSYAHDTVIYDLKSMPLFINNWSEETKNAWMLFVAFYFRCDESSLVYEKFYWIYTFFIHSFFKNWEIIVQKLIGKSMHFL